MNQHCWSLCVTDSKYFTLDTVTVALCSCDATHSGFLECNLGSQTLQNCKNSWCLDLFKFLQEEIKGVRFADRSAGNSKRCLAEIKLNLGKKKKASFVFVVSLVCLER